MPEDKDECVAPAKGPIGTPEHAADGATGQYHELESKEGYQVAVRVGKPAPDFEANGFLNGGFKPFRLSDYKGQWVVLCFYPGDFTFV